MGWNRARWISAIGCAFISVVTLPRYLTYLIPPPRITKRPCPLIDAIKQGETETVRLLFAQGADPNARETQVVVRIGLYSSMMEVPEALAKTALILAIAGGHKQMVELLLDSGADINARSGAGDTALTWALGRDQRLEVAKLLLDRGADTNAWGFEPPLTIASTGNRIDQIKLLLDNGAEINATDDEGFTALMEPAESGYEEVVAALIAAGIDVNARNKEGLTALQYARKMRQTPIVELLLNAGARE